MTKIERVIIEEICELAEGNPGGFMVKGEYDPEDGSPEDITVLIASEIRVKCRKLLGLTRRSIDDDFTCRDTDSVI